MDNKKNKVVLVTGNSGFVGRNLTRELLNKGISVVGFDVQHMDTQFISSAGEFAQEIVNLCNLNELENAFERLNYVDYVFHTVAIQPSNNEMNIQDYLDINFIGSFNLIRLCNKYNCKNIILSSSFSIYGEPKYLPIDEKHPTLPRNPYAISKLLTEQLFEYYSREKDFHVTILRYDGIYGRDQTISGFVEYLTKEFSKNNQIELFHEGKQVRDNVYVEDVVSSNLLAMEYNSSTFFSIFNIGGNEPKSSFETSEIIKKAMNSDSSIIKSKKSSPMGYDIYLDNKKAITLLGYKPNPLKENIKKIIQGSSL